MIFAIYKKAFSILMKRPVLLWGISLLCALLAFIAGSAFALLPAVAFVIALALEASMALIYLNSYRTEVQPQAADLFTAFKKERFGRVVGGMAWMELWIFLWALIPIVGIVFAIIRTYEYRFTPYILMTRDDVKATDAIKISKQQTKGLKGKMFWADVLVAVAFGVASGILSLFGQIPYVGILFTIIYIVAAILYFLLCPLFLGLVQADFYLEGQQYKVQATAAAAAAAAAAATAAADAAAAAAAAAPEAAPEAAPAEEKPEE